MRVYDIAQQLAELEEALELSESGEITEEELTELHSLMCYLMDSKEEKLTQLWRIIRNKQAEEAAIAHEVAKLGEKKKAAQRTVERLESLVKMLLPEGEKFQNNEASFGWRKSSKVVVTVEPEALPELYRRVKYEADKSAIGKAIKGGDPVPGCIIEEGIALQVK